MDWNKRLMKEARSFVPDEIVLSLAPVEDRLDYWRATISGPKDSPYEGGISFLITTGTFELEITVPKTYPMSPPQINFFTPLCHPNIEFSSGKICLDLLNDAWTPSWSIYSALGAVAILLQNPQPDSPLNVDAANLLRDGDNMGYHSLVKMYTLLHATPP